MKIIGKESVKYSLNNIKKSKARSILTILSIFVGIATIFIFVSYGWGLYDYIDEFTSSSSADKLLIQPKGGTVPGLDDTFPLYDDDLQTIENTPGIYGATGVHMTVAEIIQDEANKYVFMMSYDPDVPMIMALSDIDVVEGRALRDGDSGKVTLGYNYMIKNKIFPKAYALNSKIEVQGQDLRIVGFYEKVGNSQDDSNIYITNDFADDIMRDVGSDDELPYGIIVARADKDNIDEVAMITSVLERFKEIGVLKSIGARNAEIFKIFLFESGFLGFVAGCIGVLVGWGGANLGAGILDNLGYGFLSPHYSWALFVGLIAFATFTGAISGMMPAWRASKINAVDALRYE